MNILVGANNSGKSTILGAFRALEAGLRRAYSKSADPIAHSSFSYGYRISEEALPISLENVHTDYADTDTSVIFKLSNGNKLQLLFPAKEGGCILIPETSGQPIRSPKTFKEAFPISIAVVPVLGPIENDEVLVKKETVQRNLATHRASRNFRNYWYHYPSGFQDFSSLVSRTWFGMEIQSPERLDPMSDKIVMFCLENRIPRELYWSGFGFQIWCQLLTHIFRTNEASLLIVDEPEVYLHPDVQRQLLGILRDAGPDVLLATHSTEIMSEADPSEILLIDKTRKAAKRLRDIEEVQTALDTVGSIQNITLTRLARNRRILFVEGPDDFQILRKFSRKLGLIELASGSDLTIVEAGGFTSWERIRSLSWGIAEILEGKLEIAAIFDRDYWCAEEVNDVLSELKRHIKFAHIHQRKEIENYLLIPEVLDKALNKAVKERVKRTEQKMPELEPVSLILDAITDSFFDNTQGQYIAKKTEYLRRSGSKLDFATIASDVTKSFSAKWKDLSTRLEVVPGKEVLRDLRSTVKSKYGVSLTDSNIIDEFRLSDIPSDLCDLLKQLDNYRRS